MTRPGTPVSPLIKRVVGRSWEREKVIGEGMCREHRTPGKATGPLRLHRTKSPSLLRKKPPTYPTRDPIVGYSHTRVRHWGSTDFRDPTEKDLSLYYTKYLWCLLTFHVLSLTFRSPTDPVVARDLELY